MLDHLAHAGLGDLDAVAVGDLLEPVVVGGELHGHRLEAVAGDVQALGEVHDRRLEHQLVVGLGLDEQDVDAGVAVLPLLGHLVEPLVGDELERLVADLGHAHVAHAPGARPPRGLDHLGEVVDVRHQRVDHDDELGARLDGDVQVGGGHDPAVDELAAVDLHRVVDHRQGAGGAHGGGDGHVVPALGAEDDALTGVQVGGGEVELALEHPEVVGAVGVREDRAHVLLHPAAGVEALGQGLRQAEHDVHGGDRAELPGELAQQERGLDRQRDALLGELADVGPQQGAELQVGERRGDLLVDDPHHLLGRDAVGRQGGHEGAGARADVDVELVDRAVDRQEVERPQGADLVDAAREAAAAEDQRGLGLLAPASGTALLLRRVPARTGSWVQRHHLSHGRSIRRRAA